MKNNIISDWLDKFGDHEIDKKVEMELEKINKERYNQIIDEVYKNYLNEWTFEKYPNDGSVYSVEPIKVKEHSKEQFVYRCKTDNEFSERWELKIEERELSFEDRKLMAKQILPILNTFLGNQSEEGWVEQCEILNVPTKQITLEYNGTKIEVYE